VQSIKRKVLCIGAAGIVLAIAGCGSSSSSGGASKAPIKIGQLTALSGPLGTTGPAEVAAVRVAIAQANAAGGVHGRKLTLVTADDQGTPSDAVTGLQSLAGKGAQFMIAGDITPICSSEFGALSRVSVVMMIESCTDDADTGPAAKPDVFRAGVTDALLMTGGTDILCNKVSNLGSSVASTFAGATSYDILNANYDLTNGQASYIKAVAGGCGVKLRKQVEVPLTATDTLPYISSLESGQSASSASNTVLVLNVFGSALLDAIKVGVSTGLFKHYKYVVSFVTDDSEEIAAQQSLGAQMPTIYQINDYYSALPGAANATFVAAYKKAENGQAPGDGSAEAYRAAEALIALLKASSSDTVSSVESAAVGAKFQTPTGMETIGSDHQGNDSLVLHVYSASGQSLITTLSGSLLGSQFTPADQVLGKKYGL
jgi:branched-chain amino acid transport system substrate-binding protein